MIRVEISHDYDRWIRGFAEMEMGMSAAAHREWQAAIETMFDRSQDVVHVITGRLKASGSTRVWQEGHSIMGEIRYDTPYAEAEENRGGSHAYLHRALEATESRFEDALPHAFESMISSWGGR